MYFLVHRTATVASHRSRHERRKGIFCSAHTRCAVSSVDPKWEITVGLVSHVRVVDGLFLLFLCTNLELIPFSKSNKKCRVILVGVNGHLL